MSWLAKMKIKKTEPVEQGEGEILNNMEPILTDLKKEDIIKILQLAK